MVGPATMVWAGLLGFSDASALIPGLTLPPLLCPPEDIARTSAGMFTISYSGAVGCGELTLPISLANRVSHRMRQLFRTAGGRALPCR
jgi:hypothetical protein